MAKPKSSSSKNGQSSPSASDNPLSSTYSNASSIYTSSSNANSNGSQHLPQHIYYKTDLRREPSAASLTPPTTISMPIPPLPQRQHNPSMTSPVAGSGLCHHRRILGLFLQTVSISRPFLILNVNVNYGNATFDLFV